MLIILTIIVIVIATVIMMVMILTIRDNYSNSNKDGGNDKAIRQYHCQPSFLILNMLRKFSTSCEGCCLCNLNRFFFNLYFFSH